MSEQLDKQTLTRMAWITELRRQGDRQCQGAYCVSFKNFNNVCALGLLMEIEGILYNQTLLETDEIGELAGLSKMQTDDVLTMNDGIGCRQHTFAEIADRVEGWFK